MLFFRLPAIAHCKSKPQMRFMLFHTSCINSVQAVLQLKCNSRLELCFRTNCWMKEPELYTEKWFLGYHNEYWEWAVENYVSCMIPFTSKQQLIHNRIQTPKIINILKDLGSIGFTDLQCSGVCQCVNCIKADFFFFLSNGNIVLIKWFMVLFSIDFLLSSAHYEL